MLCLTYTTPKMYINQHYVLEGFIFDVALTVITIESATAPVFNGKKKQHFCKYSIRKKQISISYPILCLSVVKLTEGTFRHYFLQNFEVRYLNCQ